MFINQERVNIPPNVSMEVKFQPFVAEKLDNNRCIDVSKRAQSSYLKTKIYIKVADNANYSFMKIRQRYLLFVGQLAFPLD